jgi:predicted nucleotidyltransferase
MTKAEAVARLRAREADLRALGIDRLSIFGSTARGDAGEQSDVDLAVRFDAAAKVGLFKFAVISGRLETIMGTKVDLVCEPAAKPRVQAGIDRDRVRVF